MAAQDVDYFVGQIKAEELLRLETLFGCSAGTFICKNVSFQPQE